MIYPNLTPIITPNPPKDSQEKVSYLKQRLKPLRLKENLVLSIILYFKRAARIELALLAWKAKVLPLNYARITLAEQ